LNLAELELENPQYLRIAAFSLMELGDRFDLLAINILRRILKIRPEEPQSYLHLGVLLYKHAKTILWKIKLDELSLTDLKSLVGTYQGNIVQFAKNAFSEAIRLFHKVISGTWDARYTQIELSALVELNNVVKLVTFFGYQQELLADVKLQMMARFEVDIRIQLMWDTHVDVELHVREPSGEKCYPYNNKTASGGILTKDFTAGYGPVEYLIKTACFGNYEIYVRLHSSLGLHTGTTVLVDIYTHFGDPECEKEKMITKRFQNDGELHHMATVAWI